MSILTALHQQHGQLDDLAKLPQAMIMQMAQRKEISPEMVPAILSRKAELADSIARTKAMQGAGAQQPTVMEQLMQKNAEQRMPQETHEAGIAQLPVEEPQYAGGGIVAFQNNPDQPVDADMKREGESESDYMKRARAVQEAGAEFFTPRNYNPIAKLSDLYGAYQENIGKPFAGAVSRFVNESPESQAAKFRSYSQQPKTEETALAKAPKASDAQYEEQGKNAYVSTPVKATAAAEPGVKSLVEKPTDKKPQSPLQKATGAPEMPETKVDPIDAMLAKYENMIMGKSGDAAAARKEARDMRLMEAGLRIMGGTSPYAFANIGQGAAEAAKGYGEDIKGLRAEETAKLNQLMGLGLKGAQLKQEAQKLGITAKHYDDWYKAQMAQVGEMGATRRDTAKLRADTALENRVATLAAKMMTQPKYMDNPDLAYTDAQRMITGQSGQNQFAGFSGKPLK
jgi:hypothetical protein